MSVCHLIEGRYIMRLKDVIYNCLNGSYDV